MDTSDSNPSNDGTDFIDGGEDPDIIHGGGDVDFLYGNTGADRILGGDGDDQIFGGSDVDVLLGGAGAVEALLMVRALQTGVLPPTINLESPDPECELDHVANKARNRQIRTALSNSFGFGGTNAALVFGRA